MTQLIMYCLRWPLQHICTNASKSFGCTEAIMATIRSSNIVSLIMIALGGLFVAFGWWGMSGTVLAVAFVVALLYTLARGAKAE